MLDANEVVIAPMAEEYIEGYHRCLDAVARERRFLGMVQVFPLDRSREFVQSNLAADNPAYVALHEGEVVGWCDIVARRGEGFTHSGHLGMGVRKDFRGRGIGTRLMECALAKAKLKGLERVELEVFASNTVAIRLYEKVGFVQEGVNRHARKLDGVYDDIVWMALLFS